MKKKEKESDLSDMIGGTLNIFGLKIDLSQLLSSSEEVSQRLDELREKLKTAGGKEVLSDEEWRGGGLSISGQVRTRGLLGEREYHIGTATPSSTRKNRGKTPQAPQQAPEVVEPAMDVFVEAEEVLIVAEVPGVDMVDLELTLEGDSLRLATKATAPRRYEKNVKLELPVQKESLTATCRNGILEIRLRRQKK